MRVILFDIDGTLVAKSSTEAGERERFRRAVYDEVGRSPQVEPWRYDGMVDPQICRCLLLEVGLSENVADAHLSKVIERVRQIYMTSEKRPILNKGVKRLLEILKASSKHKLGVLTGNLSVVADEKLRLTGIRTYFVETFCSDGYLERGEMAKDAVRRCVEKYRLTDDKSVMILGDTPHDVRAARSSGATVIAVASGFFSESDLAAEGPDMLFRDLDPSRELLTALDMEAA